MNYFRTYISAILLFFLLVNSFVILHHFLPVIGWAAIISLITWSTYQKVHLFLNTSKSVSAFIMTLSISILIFSILFSIMNALQNELKIAYHTLDLSQHYSVPNSIQTIPLIGQYIQNFVEQLNNDRENITLQIIQWVKQWLDDIAKFLGNIIQQFFKIGLTFITVFFFFRDGEKILHQLKLGLSFSLGINYNIYLETISLTAKTIAYGLVLAALAQGIMAGIGYTVIGLKAPFLFGALTALMGLIPMGANVVWIPICLGFILTNQLWEGISLALWGFLVISKIDDVVRLFVISSVNQIPFLIALFGIFGGLSAFGLIGIFAGPIVLNLLLISWQTWVNNNYKKEE